MALQMRRWMAVLLLGMSVLRQLEMHVLLWLEMSVLLRLGISELLQLGKSVLLLLGIAVLRFGINKSRRIALQPNMDTLDCATLTSE